MNHLPDHQAPGFTDTLRKSIQQNPVAAGLIGAGALLLLFGGKRTLQGLQAVPDGISAGFKSSAEGITSSARSAATAVGDAVGSARDAVGTAGEKISELGRNLGDTASSFADSAQDATSRTAKQASSAVRSSRRKGQALFNDLQDVLERQPLALGAIGLAIGSAVAASLPTSRLESETFGDTSDAFRRSVKEHFADQSDQLVQTAQQVMDAVKEESRQQGLTPDGLKRDLQDKMSDLSDTFRESVKERTS